MSKSTTATRVREAYGQQMSFRLTEKEAKALHLLAQRDGSKAAALLRRYIRETYRLIFGKEV